MAKDGSGHSTQPQSAGCAVKGMSSVVLAHEREGGDGRFYSGDGKLMKGWSIQRRRGWEMCRMNQKGRREGGMGGL